ncbi:MAG: F0F1 ATP synthase subunit A [Candidatus Omnitrophica bacterium]|nr:F0F1 ATP synthase subunit A [Candidatus Omnitrophota bacterium]
MNQPFLKSVLKNTLIFCGAAVILALFLRQWAWAGGLFAGFCWAFLSVYFLNHLIEMGLNSQEKPKKNIFWILTFKFPVLYLAGFFILKSRFFPVLSVVAGLSLFIPGFLYVWLKNRKAEARLGVGTRVFFLFSALSFSGVTQALASEPAHEGAKGASLHILNFVRLFSELFHGTFFSDLLDRFENVIFGFIVIAVIGLVFFFASRRPALVPGRFQSCCESILEGLQGFVCGILGPEGKKYTPFLGTLFLYIWTMNLIGLVPLMKAPTANSMILTLGGITVPIPTTTAALAILVFLYVQSIGIRRQGILGYLDHMAGNPRDIFGFILLPLMFVIHLIGEFAKPLSLAFRLYGNIWGEDVLLAVFMGLGIGVCAFLPVPAAVPLQFPFLLLAMVTGTIQAFVFTLLSTVYIAMMLPHEHPVAHAAHS